MKNTNETTTKDHRTKRSENGGLVLTYALSAVMPRIVIHGLYT